ncbi:MAG: aldo/keto reductase [Planctomycetota bacterium]
MERRKLGTTDLEVSVIGFGCWTMGGPNFSPANGQPIGWADVNKDDVLAGIKAGLDAGVNHFDNADIYGNGRAERLLRECLDELGHLRGSNRDRLVIASKIGHMRGTAEHPYLPRHIRNQCEQSLMNLGVDHIDLYYFHHGGFAEDGQPGNLRDAAETMHELVREGKVRAVGQSAYSDEDFARTIPVVKPAVLQSHANLLDQVRIANGCKTQELMDEHGCTFIAFGPLGQGLLLDKFDADNPPTFADGDIRGSRDDFKRENLLKLRDKLTKVKERFGAEIVDLSSVASRFLLGHRNVSGVIPGFRNARQATMNVRAGADAPLSESDLAFLRELFPAS